MQYFFYLIVHFETGKHGILKSHIHPNHMVDQRVSLMCFQRGGDGEASSCISIQDVHQFLLLYCTCICKSPQITLIIHGLCRGSKHITTELVVLQKCSLG